MLSQERKDILMGIIKGHKHLLMLEPNEAISEIKKLGNDFTLDEINEFAVAMKASGELPIDSLEDVSGGVIINPICIIDW